MLDSVLTTDAGLTSVTALQFLECTLASIVLGIFCSLIYMYRNHYHKSFVVTLALMPLIVQIVIMLVNGNLGAGVAVMGAFSLVRFRSIPGTARDIGSIFCAMALGLATGMGYLAAALVFLTCFAIVNILLNTTKFGEGRQGEKQLKITIPENLDYMGIFDDLFEKYTKEYHLTQVRTTNMGSLFELTYTINLKSEQEEKKFIDDIRCRNGNLKIVCGLDPETREMI